MRRHTVLIEFAQGDGPGYHKGMHALGGEIVAVQFSDALAELERTKDALAELIDAADAAYPPGDYSQDAHGYAVRAAIAAATGDKS